MPKIQFKETTPRDLPTPPPNSGRVVQSEYWDESQRGFGLRISSTGVRTWFVMGRTERGGKSVVIRSNVGRYNRDNPKDPTSLSLADARAKANALQKRMSEGHDPREAKTQERARRAEAERTELERQAGEAAKTFGAVTDAFLAKVRRKKDGLPIRAATRRQYETLKGADFADWRDRPFAEITRRVIRERLERIKARGVTAAANNALAAVRRLMNWAIANDYCECETSPAAGIEAPAPKVHRTRHLFGDRQRNKPSEIALAWQAFERCGWYAVLLKLLLLTGQREDEVAGMRWDELIALDGTEPRWLLGEDRTKNRLEHMVPLGPLAAEIIRSMPRVGKCPFVFTLNGKTPANGFSKLKVNADAAITALKGPQHAGQFDEPWRFHDLRRTFTSGLQELDVDTEIREMLVNHVSGESRQGVKRHYDHGKRWPARRAAVLLWEQHITSLLTPNVLALAA